MHNSFGHTGTNSSNTHSVTITVTQGPYQCFLLQARSDDNHVVNVHDACGVVVGHIQYYLTVTTLQLKPANGITHHWHRGWTN